MKTLGMLSAILDQYSFEEVIDLAAVQGFSNVELAAWPRGEGERRYAGVSHMDVVRVIEDAGYREYVQTYCTTKGVTISALGYYPNPLDADTHKRQSCIAHLKKVIEAAALLDIGLVTTFIGRDQYRPLEENLEIMEVVWTDILEVAEKNRVRIAIENCPMLFDANQWPGGQNLMTTPVIWREVFRRLPSEYLGINFDPSHFVWQKMDYIKPVHEFKDKIFHVHIKDIKLNQERLEECGIMAYPLMFMSPRIPGHGDVRWGKFLSALHNISYQGNICVEIEDKEYEDSQQNICRALQEAKEYIEKYM